jgi:hypothetical protein
MIVDVRDAILQDENHRLLGCKSACASENGLLGLFKQANDFWLSRITTTSRINGLWRSVEPDLTFATRLKTPSDEMSIEQHVTPSACWRWKHVSKDESDCSVPYCLPK